jgi:hypothetical protein
MPFGDSYPPNLMRKLFSLHFDFCVKFLKTKYAEECTIQKIQYKFLDHLSVFLRIEYELRN